MKYLKITEQIYNQNAVTFINRNYTTNIITK